MSYHIGQRVLRYMGDATGYCAGEVVGIDSDGIRVQFSGLLPLTLTVKDDEYLIAENDPSVPERLAKAEATRQELDPLLNQPLFTPGAITGFVRVTGKPR